MNLSNASTDSSCFSASRVLLLRMNALIRVVLSGDFLWKNNMSPWWETLNSGFSAVYIAFIVVYGIIRTDFNPNCSVEAFFPLTSEEAENFNKECTSDFRDIVEPLLIWAMFGLLLRTAMASNVWLLFACVHNTIIQFQEASVEFLKIPEPLHVIKSMYVTPRGPGVHPRASVAKDIDKLAASLWRNVPGPTVLLFLLRDIFILSHITMFLGQLFPYLEESLEGSFISKSEIRNSQWHGWKRHDVSVCKCTLDLKNILALTIFFIFGVAVNHAILRLVSLYFFFTTVHKVAWRSIPVGVSKSQAFICYINGIFKLLVGQNNSPLKTRMSMLYIDELGFASRGSKDRDFLEFVKFIFSEDAMNSLIRCYSAQRDGNILDRKFADLIKCMIGDVDIEIHFINSKNVMSNRSWENLVQQLNETRSIKNKDILQFLSLSEVDDSGNSLLFYALRKPPNGAAFHTRAAKLILKYNNDDRVVRYNGQEVPALQFVQHEYDSDVSYPISKRHELLDFIVHSPSFTRRYLVPIFDRIVFLVPVLCVVYFVRS